MVYRHLVYDNTSRNDSAMDLSRNDRYHNTRSDLDDSPRVIPPSAEPSGSLPWSQFNTRVCTPGIPISACTDTTQLGSDYATTNDNFGDLTATYQGLNTYSPASLDVFDSYIPDPSGLRCSTPGIDSPTDLSVPPSPPSPPSIQQWASSSMATPSSILFHRTHRDNDFIGCDQCSTRFTGRHRNGNRGRHMRLKHSKDAVIEYRCLAEECNKTFQRTDARLKHVRNSHPALLQASPQYKHDIAARWEVPTGSVLPFNPPSLIAPPVTPRLASGALVAKKALNELDYICSYTQQEQEDQATGAEFGIAGAPEDRPYIFTAGCINDATPHIDPYLLDLSSTTARGGSYSLETTKTPSSGLEDILRGVLSQLDLDQPTYSRAWVAFFTRWGYVLQELLDKR